MNAYLRAWANEWMAAKKGRTNVELGKSVGVTDAQISVLRNHGRGVGSDTEDGFARVMGITVDELRERASAWAREHADKLPQGETGDPYPNRAAVLELLRAEFPAEILASVAAATGLPFVGDPPRWWWADRVRAEANLRGFQPALPKLAPVRDDGEIVAAMANNTAAESQPAPARAQSSRHKRVGS